MEGVEVNQAVLLEKNAMLCQVCILRHYYMNNISPRRSVKNHSSLYKGMVTETILYIFIGVLFVANKISPGWGTKPLMLIGRSLKGFPHLFTGRPSLRNTGKCTGSS